MEKGEARARIAELEAENRELRERIAELERRMGLDSKNSSKPPSSDGMKKAEQRTKSLRTKSKRANGGQRGHKGKSLKMVEHPTRIERHQVAIKCAGCGTGLEKVPCSGVEKRQVFDIPEIGIEVTEHQVESKDCPHCGEGAKGEFPEGVKAPVQYGARIRGVGVYLNQQQLIPEQRTSEVLSDLFGVSICPATVVSAVKKVEQACEPCVESIKQSLEEQLSKHLDETGFRIGGKCQWLHVVSTEELTWYRISDKRKDLEPLSSLKGVVIHDHWKPYYQLLGVEHGLCNAHHLRELKALDELDGESWARNMARLLRLVCGYRHRYPDGIPLALQQRIRSLYDQLVNRGLAYHLSLSPLPRTAHQGRTKRRTGHNLLRRLRDFADDVLRCLSLPHVPFTNNQAERDLRMMKLKQKISGGFRSSDGAKSFATIRSVLSTARKQGCHLLSILTSAVQGYSPVFDL